MKRGLTILLSLLLVATLFIGCSNDNSTSRNDLGYVTFGESSKRGLSSSVGKAPGLEQLSWTYTATKSDGGFTTGETESGTVSFGSDGKSTQVGPFSVGTWEFTLSGYTQDGDLIYTGSAEDVKIVKGTDNNISIAVQYQGGEGNGYLVLDSIYIKNSDGIITSSSSVKATISGTDTVLTAASDNGIFTIAEATTLKSGVYTLTFSFTDSAENEVASATKTVFILTGKTTTVKGDVTEYKANGSFDVTTNDSSYIDGDNYYIVTLNGETAVYLKEGAAAEDLVNVVNIVKASYPEATIYLNGNDIDLEDATLEFGDTASIKKRSLSKTDVTLDLDSSKISGNGVLFSVGDGQALSIKGGEIESKGATIIETAGTVELTNSIKITVNQEDSSVPAIKVAEGATSVGIVMEDVVVTESVKAIVPASSESVAIATTNVKTTSGEVSTLVPNHVAKVGKQGYETLKEALANCKAGDTLTLIVDIDNSDLSTVQTISLPALATLDGNGHTISGNVSVYVNKEGGTIINTTFENIHNNTQVVSSFYGFTSDDPKIGNLTAVYASGLAGKLVIKDCTFDSIDWDAIQATPISGAEIEITGDTFIVDSSRQGNQIRCIHVQSSVNTDFAVTATGNYFYNCTYLNQTGLEVYYPSDLSKVNLSGNYIDSPFGVCIETGNGVSNPTLALPFIGGQNGEEAFEPVAYITTAAGNYYFEKTLKAAINDAKSGETITLIKDITVDSSDLVSVQFSKTWAIDTYISKTLYNLTIDGNGHKITTAKDSSLFYTAMNSTIKNLTVEVNNKLIGFTIRAQNSTYSNVTLEGNISVTGNCGGFVQYGYGDSTHKLSFVDCVNNAAIVGQGGSKDYNAVFVGYPMCSNIEFIRCVNNGSLICGKAAMFVGNASPAESLNYTLNLTVEDCVNNGTIIATSVDDTYSMNYYVAQNNTLKKLVVNGVEYAISGTPALGNIPKVCFDTVITNNNKDLVYNGPVNTGMKLTRNDNGTFNFVPATDGRINGTEVASYSVGFGLYVTLTDGTNRFYVAEDIQASELSGKDSYNTTIKEYRFVDSTFSNGAEVVADELNHNTVVVDGVTYYIVKDGQSTGGVAKAATIFYLSAYDKEGNLLGSVSLS